MRVVQNSLTLVEDVTRRNFLRVCVAAFLLRLMLLIYIAPNTPIKYYANPDAHNYERIALNLVNNRVYSNELNPPYLPDVRRPPLYPTFLAGIYAWSGSSRTVAVLFQLLLGGLTVGLTYLFAEGLLLSRRNALFAALILALDPLSIMYANMLVTETLFTFYLVAGSLTLVSYIRSYRLGWLILSACMFASAALTRPIGQFLPLVLLPLIVVAGGVKQIWPSFLKGLLFTAISLTLIFGWVFRNFQAAGIWSLSSTAEFTLTYYSARAVLEVAEQVDKKTARARIDDMIKAQAPAENLSPAEMAKLERQVALGIFKKHPAATVNVYLAGIFQFLMNPGLDNICAQLSRAGDVKGCEATRSIERPSFVERLQSKFGNMDGTQLMVAVWSVLFLFTLYVLSAIGVYALIKRNQWFELLLLGIMIVYLIGLSAGGQTTSRFRVPTMPYWSVLAGVGWGLIRERLAMK
jgi:4-amino-4-deoxy-L-arabinose transferase-like glycosyltransferase